MQQQMHVVFASSLNMVAEHLSQLQTQELVSLRKIRVSGTAFCRMKHLCIAKIASTVTGVRCSTNVEVYIYIYLTDH